VEPTEHNRRAWDEIHRQRAEAAAGGLGIPEPIRERMPEIAGKHVLHLQCRTGEATAELAELGALVTAVDASAEALETARELAPNVVFVQGDVDALPLELHRHRFDLVFTGGGVLGGLNELDTWAAGIVSALKPGGQLLLYDDHPVAGCIDHLAHWRADYFDREAWQLGEVVTALAQSGLVVRRLEELGFLHDWELHDKRIPGHFLVLAENPA
jgi:SAM-dependent methyltransferase